MNLYAVCMSICAYVSDGSQQGDRRPVHAGVENQAHISKPKTHWAAAGGLTEKQCHFSNWRLMCNRPLCRRMAKAREHTQSRIQDSATVTDPRPSTASLWIWKLQKEGAGIL